MDRCKHYNIDGDTEQSETDNTGTIAEMLPYSPDFFQERESGPV